MKQWFAWLRKKQAGVMDEFIVTSGMWIFASMVVIVLAGLIWGALSDDMNAMVGILQNLF